MGAIDVFTDGSSEVAKTTAISTVVGGVKNMTNMNNAVVMTDVTSLTDRGGNPITL